MSGPKGRQVTLPYSYRSSNGAPAGSAAVSIQNICPFGPGLKRSAHDSPRRGAPSLESKSPLDALFSMRCASMHYASMPC